MVVPAALKIVRLKPTRKVSLEYLLKGRLRLEGHTDFNCGVYLDVKLANIELLSECFSLPDTARLT